MNDIYNDEPALKKQQSTMRLKRQRPMKSSFFPPDLHESDLQRFGYVHLDINGCQSIVLELAAEAVARIIHTGTLHAWAAQQTLKEEMRGRGVIYSVDLPASPAIPVVVRRNQHGGLLRALTGEYFITPTRAPLELATSLRLAAAGIPTPEIVAYAIYPAGILARSDVMTLRLPEGDDFPAAWKKRTGAERDSTLVAVARLLSDLASAGAWHADLNLKNIYISNDKGGPAAYLLDVDRVTFPGGSDIFDRNFRRLARSARKWRDRWGLDIDEDALARLASLALEKKR